jgi:predicted phage terminase large subunit-like protein
MVLIAHRLHERDLPGILIEEGGWNVISLPLIAEEDTQVAPGFFRPKGSLLRPAAFTDAIVDEYRSAPNFEALYQQRPGGDPSLRISSDWLRPFASPPPAGAIISVDTGGSTGPRSAYSALQVWTRWNGEYYLLDATRGRWAPDAIFEALLSLMRRHRPIAILVERNSFGIAIVDRLKRRQHPVHEIVPNGAKSERLRAHLDLFRAGKVLLPPEFEIRFADYVEELTNFPHTEYADQVDATTQALAWLRSYSGALPAPRPRALGATGRGFIAGR